MNFLRTTLLALSTCLFVSNSHAESSDRYLVQQGADSQITLVRQAVEKAYHNLVAQGHIDEQFRANPTMTITVNGDTYQEGMFMLALIDWLIQHKNNETRTLLHKLNHLYYLELKNIIASLDGDKTANARMLQLCKELRRHKTINPTTHKVTRPFRTSISRLFIVITAINGSSLAYENRKKSLAMALDQIGSNMLSLNKKLMDQKISDRDITECIALLATHAFAEPFMKPQTVKWVIAGSIAGVIIAYFAFDYLTDAIVDRFVARGKKRFNDNRDEIKAAVQEAIRQVPAVSLFVPYTPSEEQAFAARQSTRGWFARQWASAYHLIGRKD